MALVLADRVKETTTTAGTGTVTLLGASAGFQSFAVIGNSNTTYYTIAGQSTSEWEVGIGTYTSAGTLLARTTVLSNSSATEPSALNFAAGTKDVFVTYPSSKSVNLDASGNATALGTPASFVGTNITGTASGLTAGNVTTNANLTGDVTSVGNAATVVTNANLTGGVTSIGNAATVVTNANLTGDVTSVGNATTLATVNSNVGSFTSASITVNAKGLITAASTGSAAVIGTTTQVAFNNAGTMAGSANLTFSGTNLTCGGTITANSDERLKTNWRDLPENFVERLADVKHGVYDRTDIEATQVGVSAQSLQVLLEQAVLVGEDGTLSVAYGNAALVACIQLAQRVVALEQTVAKLTKGI